MLKYNLKEEAIYSYRTIFISDIHLGTRGCQAEYLLEFIKYTNSEKLYLIGDIIDGWALKKSWYWPQTHNDVIQNHEELIKSSDIYKNFYEKQKKGLMLNI